MNKSYYFKILLLNFIYRILFRKSDKQIVVIEKDIEITKVLETVDFIKAHCNVVSMIYRIEFPESIEQALNCFEIEKEMKEKAVSDLIRKVTYKLENLKDLYINTKVIKNADGSKTIYAQTKILKSYE